MKDEFSRTERILGQTAMDRLYHSTVAVFGVGGVGSHCVEALARCGVGRLILIDADTVALSNINRQVIALHSTIGRPKTSVMKERIADINPSAKVYTYETFVLPDNLTALMEDMPKPDYVVDAIDTVSAKLALAEYAAANDIPLIASMGTGNKLHPELFTIADLADTSVCPLCRVMRRELKKRGIDHLKVLYSAELPIKPVDTEESTKGDAPRRQIPGSISFVPPVAGLLIAAEVVRFLTQELV